MGYWRNAKSVADEVADLEYRLGWADGRIVELESKLEVMTDEKGLLEDVCISMEHAMISAAPFLPSRPETEDLLNLVKGLVAQALEKVVVS